MINSRMPPAVRAILAIVFSITAGSLPSVLHASYRGNIKNSQISAVIAKFEQISSIPRCPGQEEDITKWFKKWAHAPPPC